MEESLQEALLWCNFFNYIASTFKRAKRGDLRLACAYEIDENRVH